MVLFELRSPYDKVQSSWLAAHQAATELNTACEGTRQSPGLGSAYTYLDDLKNSLRITLKDPGRTLGNGGDPNATETS